MVDPARNPARCLIGIRFALFEWRIGGGVSRELPVRQLWLRTPRLFVSARICRYPRTRPQREEPSTERARGETEPAAQRHSRLPQCRLLIVRLALRSRVVACAIN